MHDIERTQIDIIFDGDDHTPVSVIKLTNISTVNKLLLILLSLRTDMDYSDRILDTFISYRCICVPDTIGSGSVREEEKSRFLCHDNV